MLNIKGRIQREGDVVHLVANRLTDLSSELASVGARIRRFPCRMDAATNSIMAVLVTIRAQ
ncbi:hypothetical protein [Phyllobacterium chamaecytisi]|uniref:hypothetical protein n=1 Tax=Phyllobacterium chamaecytisi TaxID=2876082 RepID=UPI00351D76B7